MAFLGLATLAIAATTAFGQTKESTIWSNPKGGLIDGGWVVQFPTGSSDWFDTTYTVLPNSGINTEDGVIAGLLPIKGIAISVADFGSGQPGYPEAGCVLSNLTLDPTGETPNLADITFGGLTPFPITPPTLFDFETRVSAGNPTAVPGVNLTIHVVAQLPPGDSGLLGIGADSGSTGTTGGLSGFTTDGYTTPSIGASFLDFGLSKGQDNSATTSCKQNDRKGHGRLRASNLTQGIGEGDHLTATVKSGDTLNLAFFGTKSGDKLRLYFNVAPCTPAVAIGPVLPTIPDGDGDGTFIRLNATWPSGFGGQTFRFSAVWGNPACSNPGVGFTNCVTIITGIDPSFGVCDDGTMESGWVVQIPSASSDYFNNNLGNGTGHASLTSMSLSVLDFVTAAAGYPTSGVSNANLGVDPSGNTPDIGSPLATVSPFTFPSGTFDTTAPFVSAAIAVPGGSLGTNVHVWVQFPPGDSGLLGIGADTSSGTNGCSFFSLDGYSSPAVSFFANWGMRVN
jgi:hypothetical protein